MCAQGHGLHIVHSPGKVLTFARHQTDARLQVFISVGQTNNIFDRACTKLDAQEPQQLLTGGV